MDCAALVDDVIACKDRHEEQVRLIQEWQRGGLLQIRRLKNGYLRNAAFYALVGLAFAGFGLYEYRFLGLQAVLLLLIGVFLLYAALANFLESRRQG